MFKKKPPSDNSAHQSHQSSFGASFTGGLALPKVQVDFGLDAPQGFGQTYQELAPPQANYAPTEFAPPEPLPPQFEPEAIESFTPHTEATPGWEHSATFSEPLAPEQPLLPPDFNNTSTGFETPGFESNLPSADNWDFSSNEDSEDTANTWSEAFDDLNAPHNTYETVGFSTTTEEPLWATETVSLQQSPTGFEPELIAIQPDTFLPPESLGEADNNSLWDRPALDWGSDLGAASSPPPLADPLGFGATPAPGLSADLGLPEDSDDDFDDFFDIEDDEDENDIISSDPFLGQDWNVTDINAPVNVSPANIAPEPYTAFTNEATTPLTTEWQPVSNDASFPSWANNPEEQFETDASFDDFAVTPSNNPPVNNFPPAVQESGSFEFEQPTLVQPIFEPQQFEQPTPAQPSVDQPTLAQPIFEPQQFEQPAQEISPSFLNESAVDISEPFVQELAPGPGTSPVYDNSDPFLQNWVPPETANSDPFMPAATEPADYWRQVAQSQTSYTNWEEPPLAGNQVNISQESTAQFLDTVHETLYPANTFDDAGQGFDEASALLFPETANSAPPSFSPQDTFSTSPQWDTPFTENAAPPIWDNAPVQNQIPSPPIQDEHSSYYDMNGPWHDPSMPVEAEVSFDDGPTAQPLYQQPSLPANTTPIEPVAYPQAEPVINSAPTFSPTTSTGLFGDEEDSDDDWALNFDEPESRLEFTSLQQPPVNEALFDLNAASSDPFDFDSNWADEDLSFEEEDDIDLNSTLFTKEALPQANILPVAEAVSTSQQPALSSDPFLMENEPLFDFHSEPTTFENTTAFEEISTPLYEPAIEPLETFHTPLPATQPSIANNTPEYSQPAEQAAQQDPNALNILHSLELTVFHRLLLVNHNQYFALMGQVGPEDEANITVLKLFAQNPLAASPEFLAVKEGQSANKEMFVVKLGHWQGILAVGVEQIQLHSELTS